MRKHLLQWLVATLAVAVFVVQFFEVGPNQPWQYAVFALIAVVIAAAVFADRHVIATVGACVAVVAITLLVTGLTRRAGVPFLLEDGGFAPFWLRALEFAPLSVAEAVPVVALVVVLAWRAPAVRGALCIGALFVVCLHASLVRYAVYVSREESVMGVVVVAIIAVGAGVMLRMRARTSAVLAETAEERARREERLDMAREMHDVVAHHVTGMLVQAQAALVVSERDEGRACRMLPGIVNGGTDALGAMRAMVRTLRDNATATATTDLIADLNALVATVREQGLPVRASFELTADVRPELGRSVLRLVQEALTNARKHAENATDVEVDVRLTATAVLLSVVDNGTARPAHSGGFGLVGMQERVTELGGRFFAGATGDGWLVTAELPLAVRA